MNRDENPAVVRLFLDACVRPKQKAEPLAEGGNAIARPLVGGFRVRVASIGKCYAEIRRFHDLLASKRYKQQLVPFIRSHLREWGRDEMERVRLERAV